MKRREFLRGSLLAGASLGLAAAGCAAARGGAASASGPEPYAGPAAAPGLRFFTAAEAALLAATSARLLPAAQAPAPGRDPVRIADGLLASAPDGQRRAAHERLAEGGASAERFARATLLQAYYASPANAAGAGFTESCPDEARPKARTSPARTPRRRIKLPRPLEAAP